MLRRLNKAILQSPIVLAAPLETRLDRRPITVEILSSGEFTLDRVQQVSLGMLIIPAVLGFLFSLFSADWTLFFICSFTLMLLGVIVWIIRLRAGMFWQATWHADSVEVVDGRYGPKSVWREPYTAFKGIQRDYGQLPRIGSGYAPSRQVHGLLLEHPDPFKSVLLHASYEPIGEDVVRRYAGEFGFGDQAI